MSNKSKYVVLILVLSLVIGFAVISATLSINGAVTIAYEDSDFDVFFSEATITTGGSVSGIGSKNLTFSTHLLTKVGDKSTLDYTIYNNSTEYDVDITINCTSTDSDYFTLTNTFGGISISANTDINTTMTAQEKRSGEIVVTQTAAYAGSTDLSVNYTCTISAVPTSRTSIVEGPSWSITTDENGDALADVGDMICYEGECFYVISNDGTNIKALAQYNLSVGGYYDGTTYTAYDTYTSMQDSAMIGYNDATASSTNTWNGLTAYSTTSDEYTGSLAESYINEYADKLNIIRANVTDVSLITKDELETLGCSSSDYSCTSSSYSWIYSTSYWTETSNGSGKLWTVKTDGVFFTATYSSAYRYGIRPVITIPASEL